MEVKELGDGDPPMQRTFIKCRPLTITDRTEFSIDSVSGGVKPALSLESPKSSLNILVAMGM